jgi:hypothetical protein
MAEFEKWPPQSRAKKLKKAKLWGEVLSVKGPAWGLTTAEVDAFIDLTDLADVALAKATDKVNRTHQDIVHCKVVFKTLMAQMRLIKNTHLQSPPRTEEEMAMVELAGRKDADAVEVSLNQVILSSKPLADHLLRLIMKRTSIVGQDRAASNYGKKIFVGMEDPNAAVGAESRYGKYLQSPPLSDTDFSWSVFTRKGTLNLDFDEKDRGKKAWFIARLEIAKGGKGGLGPLFWTIIP